MIDEGTRTDSGRGVPARRLAIRLLIAEDVRVLRDTLVALVSLEEDIEVVAAVASGERIVPAAIEHRPDVALLDVGLPGADGLSAATELAECLPQCRVLVLTGLGTPDLRGQAVSNRQTAGNESRWRPMNTPHVMGVDAGRRMSARLCLYGNPLRQAFSASTWRAAWYLLAYQVVGWALLAAAAAAASTAAVFAITLVGLPLLVTAAGVIRACANAERRRLRAVLCEPVEGRYREVAGSGVMAQARRRWTDPATWRDVAYLVGMFIPLAVVGLVTLTVWLTLAAGVTLPLWYWALFEHYPHGVTVRGVQLGYFPNGPSGPGAVGFYVDTLPKAMLTGAVCLVLFALFSYVLVLTARMYASVARALLRPPQNPLARAEDLLRRPGPLPSLSAERAVVSAPAMRVQLTGRTGNRPAAPPKRSVRPQAERGHDAPVVQSSTGTSGRAIVVSGLTVMIALSGLFLTGLSVFDGIALGSIAVVGIAVAGSLTVLPALLSWLGPRADRGRIPFLRRAAARPSKLWAIVVRRVVRHPLAWGGAAVIALLALAAPALGMRIGYPAIDAPNGLAVVRTMDRIQQAFPEGPSPVEVVMTGQDLVRRDHRVGAAVYVRVPVRDQHGLPRVPAEPDP